MIVSVRRGVNVNVAGNVSVGILGVTVSVARTLVVLLSVMAVGERVGVPALESEQESVNISNSISTYPFFIPALYYRFHVVNFAFLSGSLKTPPSSGGAWFSAFPFRAAGRFLLR